MLKSNTNTLPKKFNAKIQGKMTFQPFIMENMGTLPDETIHIMPGCTMHLYGHQNKVMSFVEPFIFVNFNNGIKFHNYTCWSTNDIQSHHLLCQVNNHHISNKDLVFLGHLEIDS
jgi:hypothetical protein